MDRRQYLATCTSAAIVAVAGCSDLEGIEDSSDEIPGYHAEQLDDAEIGVTEVSREEGDAIIEYQTTATGEDEIRSQIGTVATETADAISDPGAFEQAVDTIRVTGFDEDGTEVVFFSIPGQWAIDFVEGDRSEDAYLSDVYERFDDAGESSE